MLPSAACFFSPFGNGVSELARALKTNFAQKKLPVRLERGKFSVWREKSGSDTEDWMETEFFLGLTVSILKKGTS